MAVATVRSYLAIFESLPPKYELDAMLSNEATSFHTPIRASRGTQTGVLRVGS